MFYGSSEHKLEFLIGETVLPYNMTVYQAVRQYGEQNDADTDTETPLGMLPYLLQKQYKKCAQRSNTADANPDSGPVILCISLIVYK